MSSTPIHDDPSQSDLQDLILKIKNDLNINDINTFSSGDQVNIIDSVSSDHFKSIRALYTLSNVLSNISPEFDERELATVVCRTISDGGEYSAAVYTKPHPDPNKSVDLITSSGISLIKLLDIINTYKQDYEKILNVTLKTIQGAGVQVCGDIRAEKDLYYFHDIAANEGINSMAALPVIDDKSQLIGCLSLYAPEKDSFKENEISILKNICKIIALCISAKTNNVLNSLISQAINKTNEGVIILGQDGNIVFANQAALSITKFSYEDLFGCHISIIAPKGTTNLPQSLQQAIYNKYSWSGRWTGARKTGDNFIANVEVSTFYDNKQEDNFHVLVFSDATSQLAHEVILKQNKTSINDCFVYNNVRGINNILSSIIKHTEHSLSNIDDKEVLINNLNEIMMSCQTASNNLISGNSTADLNYGDKDCAIMSQRRTVDLPHGDETILLVDDEPDLVDSLTMLLTGLGYQVVGKTSSVSALRDFKSSPDIFDIVITDMTMPKMMGNELIGHLLEIKPDIPIILCSGLFDQKDFNIPKDRVTILEKPSRILEIATAIRTALDK